MEPREELVPDSENQLHRLRLRRCENRDIDWILGMWVPLLESGPDEWLDKAWEWELLADPNAGQLVCPTDPEWLVLVDELEPGSRGEVLGGLVTTGPVAPTSPLFDASSTGPGSIVLVEYIVIAPNIRPDCPAHERRKPLLKGIGPRLMVAAVERSEALSCEGRIGLLAEGEAAYKTYKERWGMRALPDAPHPAGGDYPVFFGDRDWAKNFLSKKR